MAVAFIHFIGEENTQALKESRLSALYRGKRTSISPNSPLIFPLSVSLKQLLHPTDNRQQCFMICATVESPYPSLRNIAIAVESIITLIAEHGLKRVVLSLLGTGMNQLPKEAVAEAMLTKIKEVLKRLHSDSIEEITLVPTFRTSLSSIVVVCKFIAKGTQFGNKNQCFSDNTFCSTD